MPSTRSRLLSLLACLLQRSLLLGRLLLGSLLLGSQLF